MERWGSNATYSVNSHNTVPSQWPLLKSQFYEKTVHVTGADEPTGMIRCPRRSSSIAIGRCAEYQRSQDCGTDCPNAATQEQIDLVREHSSQEEEEQPNIISHKTFGAHSQHGLLRSSTPQPPTCPSCGQDLAGELEHCEKCERKLAMGTPESICRCGHPRRVHSKLDKSCLNIKCACWDWRISQRARPLSIGIDPAHTSTSTLSEALKTFEKNQIENALIQADGNRARAAQILGITKGALWRKISSLDIGL